ncbi:MAG: hypothetical protein IJP89_01640 [Synergistaceae bacterium]|nr:hypothetical protein [Synergistaceae bacterium]
MNDFETRLAKHYDELKWLYYELYGSDKQAFDYFCSMLRKCWEERPDYLKHDLDDARAEVPDWYAGNDILGMMMYTECFAKTLQGIKSHLDYIQECGVTYLHLMPLLDTPKGKSDGGYAVSDFRKVRPDLGTMEDLADLSAKCHSLGISVCLDFVMNHTSEDHEWAKRARRGEKEFQDRYFFFDNWEIPNQFEQNLPEVFPTTAPGNFTFNEESGKVVMTTFYPYQWDLNYRNPVVFNDMTENMLYLCNQGIDIIRLDAVPYIWKTLGTNCRNLPQVHTLVRIMRMAAEIVCPGTLLLGEVVMEPSKVVPYFGTVEKPECNMLYNVTTMASTWHTVATQDTRLMKHQLESVFALPKQYVFLNYLRCHDDIGWGLDYDYLRSFGIDEVAHKKYLNDYFKGDFRGSPSRGETYNDAPELGDARMCGTTASLCGLESADKDSAVKLDIMLHAFLFTQSGIPVLYSGDEIGQLNDYSYHDSPDPDKAADSRYVHRGAFHWEDAEKREDMNTPQGRIFTAIRTLMRLRDTQEVFANEADTWLIETGNNHVLGIGRYYGARTKKEKMIALFNFSKEPQTFRINESLTGMFEYSDMITGERFTGNSIGQIQLEGFGFLWLMAAL